MPGAKMDPSTDDGGRVKDLDLSTEELGRFEKALKDPKFVEMLSEYAKEMTDPKRREENEEYLRQLEREGQGGAVYGKDTELVAPHAGFCVKTKNKLSGAKAFINICHSQRVAGATSIARADGSGADWAIPYTLSTARTDKDKAGKECEVHDFVIASTTLVRCQTDRRFKTFVIETALDSVEAQRQCRLDRSFTLPKLRFKGPGGSPPVLAVKVSDTRKGDTTAEASPVSPLQPSKQLNSTSSPFSFDKTAQKLTAKAPGRATGQPGTADRTLWDLERAASEDTPKDSGSGSGEGAAIAVSLGSDTVSSGKIEEVIFPSKASKVAETQPSYEIVQQGEMDLSSFWLDERREPVQASRPQSLLLKVDLPLVASASAVDLDVSEQRVVLRASGHYHLDVPLPYPVEESKGRAKFDKVRRRLEVTLPVVRQPMPPRKRFEEPKPADGHAESDTAENSVEPPENEQTEASEGIVFEASETLASETTDDPSTEQGNKTVTEILASGTAGSPRRDRTAEEDADTGEEKPTGSNRLAPVSGILSPGCPVGKGAEMGGGVEPSGAGQGCAPALGEKFGKRVTLEERLGSAETEAMLQANGGEANTLRADEAVLAAEQVEVGTDVKELTSLMWWRNKDDSEKLSLHQLTSSSALAYEID